MLVVPLLLWSIASTAGCAEAFTFANTGGCFQIIVETSALCDAV